MQMSGSFFNPEYAAHPLNDIAERRLSRSQLPRDLDLDAGEHGHALPHHVGRDLNLSPSTKIGPTLGGGMERSGLSQSDEFRGAAHDLTGPSHPGVDTEKAFVRGQGCQDLLDTFRFFRHERL